MLRASHSRRRFTPNLVASSLESREMLSGMFGSGPLAAPHPLASSPPPNSSVGPIVADVAMRQSPPPNSSVGPIIA